MDEAAAVTSEGNRAHGSEIPAVSESDGQAARRHASLTLAGWLIGAVLLLAVIAVAALSWLMWTGHFDGLGNMN